MTSCTRVPPAIGDRFGPFVRESDLETWNRYAAVNDEFVSYHMDDDAGRLAGYPTAIAMGNLTWAYLHVCLHQWFGESCRIIGVEARFREPVLRRAHLSVHGELLEIEGCCLTVGLRVESGDDVVTIGSARVELVE